jgi:hypothetical protein
MDRCIVVAALTITGLVFVSGCAAQRSCASTRYVFEMSFEDLPASEQPPRYFVFEDERTVFESVEGIGSARLTWAALAAHREASLEYRMPELKAGGVLAGIASVGWASERRFTVFSPGYRAVTVLPYGTYGRPPEEPPINCWDAPGILRSHVGSLGTRMDVSVPLSCSKESDGAYHSLLPVTKLSPEVNFMESLVLRHQIWVLACATKEHRLDAVDGEIREAVCDAVARQHDCWGTMISRGELDEWLCRHKPTFAECAQSKDTPCRRIKAWADQTKVSIVTVR